MSFRRDVSQGPFPKGEPRPSVLSLATALSGSSVFPLVAHRPILTLTGRSLARVLMELESKIRELCQQVTACEDDRKCVRLLEELGSALHEYVEAMRGKVIVFPVSDPVFDLMDLLDAS